MSRKYHHRRVERTTFRKLPFGAKFALAEDFLPFTYMKQCRRGLLYGWENTNGTAEADTLPDVSVPVIRAPREFEQYDDYIVTM